MRIGTNISQKKKKKLRTATKLLSVIRVRKAPISLQMSTNNVASGLKHALKTNGHHHKAPKISCLMLEFATKNSQKFCMYAFAYHALLFYKLSQISSDAIDPIPINIIGLIFLCANKTSKT